MPRRRHAEALKDFDGELMIAYGDMPLMTAATFEASFAARGDGLAIVAFRTADPGAYGRVILDSAGKLDRIVEFKDANQAERKTDLCNAGVLAADARKFFGWVAKLDNKNAQGEFYLTDVPALAKRDGAVCSVATVAEDDALGVNSRAELAEAEHRMQNRSARQGAGGGRGHDRAGNRVSLVRHGAGRGCFDRTFCGVRTRK